MTAHNNVDIGFDFLITLVFAIVSLLFLFPNNLYLPLDRRLAGLIGSALCTLLIWLFPQNTSNNVLYDIDIQVLLVLIAIMAINFVIMRQPKLLVFIKWMQVFIQHNPNSGFWLVSFISFIVSPFIMNDGLCLLLVTPVLDAFCLNADDVGSKFDVESNDNHEAHGVGDKSGDSSKQHNKHSTQDPFYFMLTIACSANIGSATTFSGNPQNIIVAQYLSRYMNCGEFFGLLILPAIASWIVTTSLLNYYRLGAAAEEHASSLVANHSLRLVDPVDGDVELRVVTGERVSPTPGEEVSNRRWKGVSKRFLAMTGVASYSLSLSGAPFQDSPDGTTNGRFSFSKKKKTGTSNGRHLTFSEPHGDVDSPLDHGEVERDLIPPVTSTSIVDSEDVERQGKEEKEEEKEDEEAVPLTDILHHFSNSSIFTTKRRSSSSATVHDLPSTVSDRLDGGLGLAPLAVQRNMEPVFEAHEPVDVVLPSGALSAVALLFFVLLIALEFVGIFSLASIFTLIAICLVGSVLLINYYRGHPAVDELGQPYTNEERVAGIAAYTEELFLDLDYNILIIFTGLFVVSGSFVHTGIPSVIWKSVAGGRPFQSASSLVLISIYVALSSQLVGNVAVVFMAKDEVRDLPPHVQKFGWCVLAWVSTVAGNLMLTGSAANIIVAEKAVRHKVVPVTIATDRHLRICFPVTALCIALGVGILYLESISIM